MYDLQPFKDISILVLFLLLIDLNLYQKLSSQHEQKSSAYYFQCPGLAQSTLKDWLQIHQSLLKCDGQFTKQLKAPSSKHYMKSHSGIHYQNQADVSSLHDQKLSARKQALHKNATAAHYENLKDSDDRTENPKQKKLALERSYLDSHLYLTNVKTPFCTKIALGCSFKS